jgi:carboxymethylenebutenolidase
VDRFRLVDEVTVTFLHDRELPWLLPGTSPTNHHASVTAIVIVEFQRGIIASARTFWDGISLESQLGAPIRPRDRV